ncbi:DUF3866 family protein [Cellulomonas chengniuliangii]|uniref:DUF3866 family protein n=1 Tax=Cellulomonas chengniuliangii TaxID=2968084 RepID=A0ABY5L568_9CELL|nr:DUF3866 family protein [Cellulomonas chengniuliangii]MCC2308451.1 DUF3866 family protein [Cellulomonas chengniuliangii]MCC2317468.1 DUF3866 family protein [Cellulomonas chengniuliangii]UUI76826.1 DUF3866 family protein [Cellulomonas chengniuliangii]
MITWRSAVVVSHGRRWPGAAELEASLEGEGVGGLPPGGTVRALAYPGLVGLPAVGERVLLNVTALARGLGTGGYAMVVAPVDTLPADAEPGPGHLVKARYTPLQEMVLGVDDQESPHHDVLRDADDLAGLPVVVADLHSALPAIVAGARHAAARAGRPAPRVAYVMTDGGALPAWFSQAVAGLRSAGWIEACVTTGQAFGGDLEAVTVHTGLLAARHVVDADLVVVAQGPGNLGTGTRWGFSGVAAGEAVNAAATLRGTPVASLRVSGADPRERHLGVSHHSLTAYGRVALAPADVVVPVFATGLAQEGVSGQPTLAELGERVRAQALGLVAPSGRHRLVETSADEGLLAALGASPVRLSTMGRGLGADPGAFLAAAVAGVHAEEIAAGRRA